MGFGNDLVPNGWPALFQAKANDGPVIWHLHVDSSSGQNVNIYKKGISKRTCDHL